MISYPIYPNPKYPKTRINTLKEFKEFLKNNNFKSSFSDYSYLVGYLHQYNALDYINHDLILDYLYKEKGISKLIDSMKGVVWFKVQDEEYFINLLAPYLKETIQVNYWNWGKHLKTQNIVIRLINKHYNVDITNIISELGVIIFNNIIVKNNADISLKSLITKAFELYYEYANNPKNKIVSRLFPLSNETLSYLNIEELPNNMKMLSWLLLQHSKQLSKKQKNILLEKIEYCLKRKNVNMNNLPRELLSEEEQRKLQNILFIKDLTE